MTNITLSRRHNANALFQTYAESALTAGVAPKGLEQSFAAFLEISPSMWSQIKSSRPIGDKLARQIERHCGKRAAGWIKATTTRRHPQLKRPLSNWHARHGELVAARNANNCERS